MVITLIAMAVAGIWLGTVALVRHTRRDRERGRLRSLGSVQAHRARWDGRGRHRED